MLLLTRSLLAALVVGLIAVAPAAPLLDPVPSPAPAIAPAPQPPPAGPAAPSPAPGPEREAPAPPAPPAPPAASGHRHLSAAWSTLFGQPGHQHRRRHHLHHREHHGDENQPGHRAGHRAGHHAGHHAGHQAEDCPSCGQRRAMLEESDELTALRIEFVKQQILQKLGLKEPPVVARTSRVSAMSKPLSLAGASLPVAPRQREDRSDDFYGRTDQVILFPDEEATPGQCPGSSSSPGSPPGPACFVFKLPADIQSEDVTRADLWLYRRPAAAHADAANAADADATNVTVAVSEVANWDMDPSFQRRDPIASAPVTDGEGWVKIDLARPVKYWLGFNELVKMVEASGLPLAVDGPYKPFVVINTNPVSQVRRPKRNARCVPGMAECCRDNLYVSFKEIGWDDWILQPAGYEAYFCRGSCTTAASLTMTGSHHNAIIRKLMQSGKKVDLVPCCTPTKYSEISLLYVNNNSTFIQKTLPNMVVEACGCN